MQLPLCTGTRFTTAPVQIMNEAGLFLNPADYRRCIGHASWSQE
jgi:hypothetical protein